MKKHGTSRRAGRTPRNIFRIALPVLCAFGLVAGMASCGMAKYAFPEGGKQSLKELEKNAPVISSDPGDWDLGTAWKSSADEYGRMTLSADTESIASCWYSAADLSDSWFAAMRVSLLTTHAADGAAEVLFGTGKGQAAFRLKIMSSPGGFSKISFSAMSAGKEIAVLNSGWIPGRNTEFFVNAMKEPGSSPMVFQIFGDEGLTYRFDTTGLAGGSADIRKIGLGAYKAGVSVTKFAVNPRYNTYGDYTRMARGAMDDLLFHFWKGGPSKGNILPTWNGYPSDVLPDARGGLWERGMIMLCMDSLYKITGDPILKERIMAEWWRIKRLYTAEELEAAGSNLHPANDDCGWHANLYLLCYEYTGDAYALERAAGMVRNTYAHFMDDALGGGLWYNNDRSYKSLYQLGVILASLQIYKYTGDQEIYDLAVKNYEWTEQTLLREDDVYWCEVNANGPVGKERPGDIKLAGSISFLGGNMAMSVAHARMYEITGDKKYLDRAIRTVKGITKVFATDTGVYLNDRDAWANGTFMRLYATEALTLPGVPEDCIDIAFRTAESIYKNDRTPDGYYGGCWQGPADGPGSRWSMIGSRPQQTMTSGSTVNILMGAALLEALNDGGTGG